MVSKLEAHLRKAKISAIKSGDTVIKDALNLILSELDSQFVTNGKIGLTDAQVSSVIYNFVKHSLEAIEKYKRIGRVDLIAIEQRQVDYIKAFLPAKLDLEETKKVVKEAIEGGAKNIGEVMKLILAKYKDRVDPKLVSEIARELLSIAS